MKKIAILLLAFLFPVYTYSQYQNPDEVEQKPSGPGISHPFYIGIGSGFNCYSGLIGISAEGKIVKNLTITGDFGLGGMGYKISGGLRYYQHYPKGVFYALGYSFTPGQDSIQTKLETTASTGNVEDVSLKINNIQALNISVGYTWTLGKRFRINLEAGYELLISNEPYKLLTPNRELSNTSKQILNLSTPGGVLLGFGFSIGL